MDGNRRWAKKENISLIQAYRRGTLTLCQIINFFIKKKSSIVLSFYAFSKENWKRSQLEQDIIFDVGHEFLSEIDVLFCPSEVSFSFIGDRAQWPEKHLVKVQELEKNFQKQQPVHVVIALSYSGQWDIQQAVARSILENQSHHWMRYLQTTNYSHPEMLIRTGYQKRLSNYYLYTLAYTELFFPRVYWPEFTCSDLENLIDEYRSVERNFGAQSLRAIS